MARGLSLHFLSRPSAARAWDIRFRVAAVALSAAAVLAAPAVGLGWLAAGTVLLLGAARCTAAEIGGVALDFAPFLVFFVFVGWAADPSLANTVYFALQAARLLLLLLLGHFLAAAATPADVAEGIRWFLTPLGRRRAWLAAQMAGWALASVPSMLDQAHGLVAAARLRGLSAARHPARVLKLLTLGLLVRAVSRSTELAAALEARGFGAAVPATQLKARWRDAGALALVSAWLIPVWGFGSIFRP